MKRTLTTLSIVGVVFATQAVHAAITVDFETPTSFESILNHYAGGADGAGVSGPNLGVSFGADALGLKNDELGPYFSNAPSPLGVMNAVGESAAMNVPVGFDGTVSFYYSANVDTSVRLWSGLDGSGTLLGTVALTGTGGANPFSTWTLASTSVSGIAQSITFGDAANVALFDNVSINPIPEPGSIALMSVGLIGMGWLVSRRKK